MGERPFDEQDVAAVGDEPRELLGGLLGEDAAGLVVGVLGGADVGGEGLLGAGEPSKLLRALGDRGVGAEGGEGGAHRGEERAPELRDAAEAVGKEERQVAGPLATLAAGVEELPEGAHRLARVDEDGSLGLGRGGKGGDPRAGGTERGDDEAVGLGLALHDVAEGPLQGSRDVGELAAEQALDVGAERGAVDLGGGVVDVLVGHGVTPMGCRRPEGRIPGPEATVHVVCACIGGGWRGGFRVDDDSSSDDEGDR